MKCDICKRDSYNIHLRRDGKYRRVCSGCNNGLTPMNIEKIKVMLRNDEGLRLEPYRCSAGKLTIGVGRNLDDKGISTEEAYIMLLNDIKECHNDLLSLFDPSVFLGFSESRQHALINMRFQLGKGGFRKFKKMIAAIRNNDWDEAVVQAKDSKWYKHDTPNRAKRVVSMMGEIT